jgi:hypothetical protein
MNYEFVAGGDACNGGRKDACNGGNHKKITTNI